MKNLYKKTDIFRCVHESHRGFKNQISVYHILKEKKCYPHGCFYFRWHCKYLSKQKKCERGFSHVGRKCTNCKYFYENKIHNYPELRISKEGYDEFLRDLDWYEDWLNEMQYKDIEVAGTIYSIKPLFTKRVYPKTEHLSFRGYLLIFKDIFLGRTHFEDYVYAHMSERYFRKVQPRCGQQLEGLARLKTDRGRLILYRMRRVQLDGQGKEVEWNQKDVVVTQETATVFHEQPEGCVRCPFGALVDVDYVGIRRPGPRRQLLCLKGIGDYKDCYIAAEYCGLDREAKAVPHKNCMRDQQVYIP